MFERIKSGPIRRMAHLALITGLLVLSTILNVFQARKINRLEDAIQDLKSEGRLAEGATVPTINAKDPDGNDVTLSYTPGQLPTLLYVFSPQCKWCERNLGNLKALAKATNGSYRFATLTLSEDHLREYMVDKDFRFPVYTRLSPD